MEEGAITTLMLKEHELLNKLLEEFESSHKIEIFKKFKEKVEKHFFIEEKVIFDIYLKQNKDQQYNVLDLIKDHKDLLWQIKKMEDMLPKNQNPPLEELKHTLLDHTNFENEFFYPDLDNELDKDKKQLILEGTKEL